MQAAGDTFGERRATAIRLAGDGLVFAIATAGTYGAQAFDRPITAVLIYLTGVIAIGYRSGLRSALFAAACASLVYNFFLSEPVFRFGVSTLDDAVPLIAFNLCAFLTGALAGRLRDSAHAARAAEADNRVLLGISERLQTAITGEDIIAIARDQLAPHGIVGIDIYIRSEDGYRPYVARDADPSPVHELLSADHEHRASSPFRVYELAGSAGEIGLAKFSLRGGNGEAGRLGNLQPVANMLALAVDRCLLLDRLSETRAVQRSEELKSAILSSVSHDLRTPLTVIEATAGGLRACNGTLSSDQHGAMLDQIVDQCRKLNRYTANLLDMGRIQSGIAQSSLQDVDVLEILGVVLATFRSTFPGQALTKKIEVPNAVVRANAPMLEQALFNILENAVVHGASDKPVSIALRAQGGMCTLAITDHGRGIGAADRPHVFDRFYRSAQPAQQRGTGLGLYVARGFTEAFGGSVTVTSPGPEGDGTLMEIHLPLADTLAALETSA